MIGFIGLGAAGGNVADEAILHGFPAIAINYSQKDLDSLEYVEEKLKLVGSEGVGKNREEAIRLIEKNWESALSFVREHFSSPAIEVIVVSFSTGGGSGSGMAPVLLDVLMSEMPEKTFVAAPILPDLSEVMVNQMNCLQTSEELSKLNLCVFPIDNEQIRKQHPNFGKNKLYKKANETFVQLFSEIVSYTEKHSKHGVLDQKDLRMILGTRGTALLSVVDLSRMEGGQRDLSERGISRTIQDSWEHSIFAPIPYERIVRAGVVFDGQESLMEFINYQKIFSEFDSGMPLDLFEGYYHDQSGKVYTVLTGLAWYNGRLADIEKNIQSKQSSAEKVLADNAAYESNVGDLSMKIRKTETKKKSVSDIINRYKR